MHWYTFKPHCVCVDVCFCRFCLVLCFFVVFPISILLYTDTTHYTIGSYLPTKQPSSQYTMGKTCFFPHSTLCVAIVLVYIFWSDVCAQKNQLHELNVVFFVGICTLVRAELVSLFTRKCFKCNWSTAENQTNESIDTNKRTKKKHTTRNMKCYICLCTLDYGLWLHKQVKALFACVSEFSTNAICSTNS